MVFYMTLMTVAYALGCIAVLVLLSIITARAFLSVPAWLAKSGFAIGCTTWLVMVSANVRLQRISGSGVLYSPKMSVCFAALSAALAILAVIEFSHPAKYIGSGLFLAGLIVAVVKILMPGL